MRSRFLPEIYANRKNRGQTGQGHLSAVAGPAAVARGGGRAMLRQRRALSERGE